MSDLLGNVRNSQSLLIPIDNRELVSFTVSLARPMGRKRLVGKHSFIDSVLHTLDDFYGDVAQHLREWQPAAPKLQREEVEEIDSRPTLSAGGDSTEPIDNAIAEEAPDSTGSSNGKLDPNQALNGTDDPLRGPPAR
jgi:hypothetical protein